MIVIRPNYHGISPKIRHKHKTVNISNLEIRVLIQSIDDDYYGISPKIRHKHETINMYNLEL